ESTAVYLATSHMHKTHKVFLENGVYIMECVNLDGVKPGDYDLICLPIKLEHGDAGLTRAVLRPI
ncbi:cyclase family protein, partial [Chloroflexota bacterium]